MILHSKRELSLRTNSEEIISKEAGALPFVCKLNDGEQFAGRHVPWHWHEWIELDYVEKGHFQIQDGNKALEVKQGEAVFINSNVLHSYDFQGQLLYYSLLCDAKFLAGSLGSYLDQKYFSPILRSGSLSVVHIKPDNIRKTTMIGYFLEIIDTLREDPKGYEFTVRNLMSRFFLLLSEESEETLATERAGNTRDMERMKSMLKYIYDNYAEQIGLSEIAEAAGISPRECSRCFRRSINTAPIRFLVEYRIQMAAALLLRTDSGISDIAEKCGFLSDSYFGKTFKEVYDCTPREYRNSGK